MPTGVQPTDSLYEMSEVGSDQSSDEENVDFTATSGKYNPGEVESIYNDNEQVPPQRKIQYLLMMAKDCIPGFDVKTTHPYPIFLGRKGWRSILLVTKSVLSQEIRRRKPEARLNIKNKRVEEIEKLLSLWPVSDQKDIDFITAKEMEYRNTLLRKLHDERTERKRKSPQTKLDRLRFILCFHDKKIREAFILSQNTATSEELGGQNSETREPSFYDLIAKKFNDEDFLPKTEALPGLHEDFAKSTLVPKSNYFLTKNNAKEMVDSMKQKVSEIIGRYEQSGNGSNLYDTDTEDDIYEGHPQWGRYNQQRAIRKNGDDRSSFLKNAGSDLLYWWHILDAYDLLHVTTTTTDLSTEHVANYCTSPSTTTQRKKVKLDSNVVDDSESRREPETTIGEADENIQDEDDLDESNNERRETFAYANMTMDIVCSLGELNKTAETYVYGSMIMDIEKLRKEKFVLIKEIVKDKDTMPREYREIMEGRIKEINDSIARMESKM
mmetsp:Transcript_26421/g.38891  ORF Transcript_26421/g.38891 Transcript_26421/m.38891 type:complete len:496 (-) Transcript_26421:208-1695(-)